MSWTWLSDTHPKARKRYRCSGCEEAIEVGECHLARRGVEDGCIGTFRWHPECDEYAFMDGDEEIISGSFTREEAIGYLKGEQE